MTNKPLSRSFILFCCSLTLNSYLGVALYCMHRDTNKVREIVEQIIETKDRTIDMLTKAYDSCHHDFMETGNDLLECYEGMLK